MLSSGGSGSQIQLGEEPMVGTGNSLIASSCNVAYREYTTKIVQHRTA
jgi:hypothetical protein